MATEQGYTITQTQIICLLQRVIEAHLEFIKIENLCMFDGQSGYSADQEQ